MNWSSLRRSAKPVSSPLYLSTFPSVKILSSGGRHPRRLKEPGESHISHVFGLMYRDGDSGLPAKEQHLSRFALSLNTFILAKKP